ncbi:tyrosine-type recombinase/integrase [Micromonospora aurantiaca]|uniref:tyrosine-type recombinase/integrase n=1 Tax=Micromonospora aurantiaca (nom. illeg.) TaxID=47850 RepID=UPI0033A706E3
MTDITPTHPAPGTVATRDDYLSDNAWRRIEKSVPESTRRAYQGDLRRYVEWCTEQQRTAVPASERTIADYASHLADLRRAPSTIDRAMAAIGKAHELAGQPKPVRTLLDKVLRGYRQEYAERGGKTRKAPAVSVTALRAMVATLNPDTLGGIRNRAILVVGFALGARRSEIAALNLEDITPHEEGVQVLIRKSKTDQDAHGRPVALPYGSNVPTCPVRALRDWTTTLAAGGRTTGPLFVRIDKHGVLGRSPDGRGGDDGRIADATVARVVRHAATAAGLDAADAFSGHSLRRGFATAAYAAPDADVLRIARHGGWKDGSATLLGYIEEVDRWRKNPLAGIGL